MHNIYSKAVAKMFKLMSWCYEISHSLLCILATWKQFHDVDIFMGLN